MKRILLATLTVLALWGGVGLNFASAQFGGLGQAPIRPRPAVSPFINLGQGGAGAFYGIIKPQLDASRSIHDLQQGIGLLNPDGSLKGQLDAQRATNALGGLQTGHSTTYFNLGHYYPMSAGSTGGSTTGLNTGGAGFNTGTGSGFGAGVTGNRTFFGSNFAQPLIRP